LFISVPVPSFKIIPEEISVILIFNEGLSPIADKSAIISKLALPSSIVVKSAL
jgi:hypothetical protein